MLQEQIVTELTEAGAMFCAPVKVPGINFYPELRPLCEMNNCGCFATNWDCPPGCGSVDTLSAKVRAYPLGLVYQYVGKLADSFDVEGMMETNRVFNGITLAIKDYLSKNCSDFLVLGAGKCNICETCTYPDAPCRFPDLTNVSVEACGINVSELCSQCGLDYIHGPNTVTNTGLILYHDTSL